MQSVEMVDEQASDAPVADESDIDNDVSKKVIRDLGRSLSKLGIDIAVSSGSDPSTNKGERFALAA